MRSARSIGLLLVSAAIIATAGEPFAAGSSENLLTTNRFLSTHWNAGQGLLTNDLRSVIQTRDGYIWIGSSAGLIRFDGVRFTHFNRNTTPQIQSDDVTSLVEDSAGVLWASFLRSGVLSCRNGRFAAPAWAESLSAAEVFTMFADDEGALCIGTSRGLFRVMGEEGRWVVGIPPGIRAGTAAAGGYYAAGRCLYQCKGWRVVRLLAERTGSEGYTSVCVNADGSLIVGSSAHLERLSIGGDGAVSEVEIAPLRQVLSVVPYGDAGHLVGSLENGVLLLDGQRLVTMPGFEALRGGGRQVRHITVDHEGGIWATTPGGLYRFRRSFIRVLGQESGIATEFSWTVRYTRDRVLWVGGGDKGTYRITDKGVRVFRAADGMPSEYVSAIYEARDGRVWFGGMYDGLSVYHRGVVSRVPGYPGRGVYSLAQDARGDLLVGGGDGLYRYSGGKFKAVDLGRPPGEVAKIRTLNPAGDGTLWMIASGRLYHISPTGARVYEAINARFGQPIMCIYVDTGRVWAGTYGGGLFLLKADSLYQIRPRGAEIGPRILGIHEDAAGFLWINAERELQRVRKEELLKASADPDATVRIWVYDHQDGLSNLDFSYVSSSSSQQLPNGCILYASTNGIVVVDTRSEPSRRAPPPVYVEDIVADGVANPAIEGPVLPPGTRRVEIRFTALQYDVPRRVRFRVKAAELDHDWVALDGLSRSVVYTSPPPGRYTFTVLASTASTEEGWTGTQASFVVAPYIYETWWFRWGGAFIAVGLLLTGYLARMRTMRRRQAALAAEVAQRRHAEEQLRTSLDEKTVMLKEIHHRVKNNLQVISSLLNLQAGMHRDEQLRHELKESQQRIRTMALIHERLYKSGNLARIGFREYVDTLVQQLGHSMGTERILCRVEGDEIMLSIGQAIPAALIVNELVTNSLKHAFPAGRSGRVVVRVADLGECRTEFSVQDDGCGLPPGFDMQRVESLGMQLVTTLVTQLEGELTVGGTAGALFKIRFIRD